MPNFDIGKESNNKETAINQVKALLVTLHEPSPDKWWHLDAIKDGLPIIRKGTIRESLRRLVDKDVIEKSDYGFRLKVKRPKVTPPKKKAPSKPKELEVDEVLRLDELFIIKAKLKAAHALIDLRDGLNEEIEALKKSLKERLK